MDEKKDEKKNEPTTKPQDYATLRFRSTGLGKTLLEGEPLDVEIVGDTLVVHIQATKPVRWHIRAAMSYRGVMKAVKFALKLSVIKFILFGWTTTKKPNLPNEF
jgi:hypothetical protein